MTKPEQTAPYREMVDLGQVDVRSADVIQIIHFLCVVLVCASLSGCGARDSSTDAVERADSLSNSPDRGVNGNGDASSRSGASGSLAGAPITQLDREAEIARADTLAVEGDLDGAASALKKLLLVRPSDVEVLFRLGNLEAARGRLQEAIDLLGEIPDDHPEASIPALGQSADWCLQLQLYDEAERRYVKILDRLPDAYLARRQLAFLLNRQGRRHEAAEHIRELCKLGNVRQDELHSLIHLSDAMYDDPSQQTGSAGENRYLPIGPAGEARKLFMDEKYHPAMMQLHASVADGEAPASIVAFYGRVAAEAQDDERFRWWLAKTDADTREFSEYWAALGTFLFMDRRFEEATRALLEAVDRDPTDLRSIGRLRSALEALGRDDQAERCSDRWKKLRDILHENNRIADASTPDIQSMTKLADMLDSLDRKLEGVLWKSLAGHYGGLPRESLLQLNSELQQLVSADRGHPTQSQRICDINLVEFPLPEIAVSNQRDVDASSALGRDDAKPPPARFTNVASDVGLQHAYQVASSPQEHWFSIYQSFGGAVAVIDYDLDGRTDLYFAQGGSDPPDFVGQQSNVLFRDVDGRLRDVTAMAAAEENRYSTGATVGDWNQDGFADIVVANVGANSLLLNNGDGTFSRAVIDDRDVTTILTTSLAMADLTGDAVPDLFEVNYLDDPDIGRRPQKNDQGEVIRSLMPMDFDPGIDRLIVNDGRGRASFQSISDAASTARAGLGVVIGNFGNESGNEVFVGNDVYPNQLWTRRGASGRWVDAAPLRGCAYSFNGANQASMGIAAGDFDRNGALDLHVTNFQDENVSLFMNERGFFQDRNVQYGLAGPSAAVLGFGTQAIDYDNDGKLDVVVTNGHIEKAIAITAPFEQPAQLFCNLGSRFEQVDVMDESNYWDGNHLGRGLARLDFNRDGRNDFVITHLAEPSALLINQTPSENHWLQLALVGTASERDSIGARIRIRFGDQELTGWVIAGDGYFCRNEAVVSFGLGSAVRVDEMVISWPSGGQQTIRDVSADQRLLVIENESAPYTLFSSH